MKTPQERETLGKLSFEELWKLAQDGDMNARRELETRQQEYWETFDQKHGGVQGNAKTT